MKKNRMMRLASVLLVLVLMTSSVVGGTFAKYTTEVEGTDTARVAKWGFEAESTIEIKDLFKKAYEKDDTLTWQNSVESKNDDVIAPGTENTADFSFTYDATSNNVSAPEVAYIFTVLATTTAEADDYAKLDANKNFVWTLQAPGENEPDEYQTFGALLEAINALDGKTGEEGKQYAANSLPKSFYGETPDGAASYTIGWKWAFETEGQEMAEQDATDTAMGNADELDKIDITITITATQID